MWKRNLAEPLSGMVTTACFFRTDSLHPLWKFTEISITNLSATNVIPTITYNSLLHFSLLSIYLDSISYLKNMSTSSRTWELHCLGKQWRVISEIRESFRRGELVGSSAPTSLSPLRSFPLLCKSISFEHSYNLQHLRPVVWKTLCTKKGHLHHFFKFDPVIIILQVLVD